MISIIIASRNEGQELYDTIKAIKESINIEHEIIVIDDCSKEPVKSEDAIVFRNHIPEGVNKARDTGAAMAKYENLAFFNARMRFFTKGWAEKMIDYLNAEKDTLFCTTSAVLYFDEKEKPSGYRYGANIYLNSEIDGKYMCFKSMWRDKEKAKCYEIPCVLGANYFIKKTFYNRIHGFNLLTGYGHSEEFVSLKAWAFGGKVKIATDVKIGNIYYKKEDKKPWSMNPEDFFYNGLVVAFTLMEWPEALNLLGKYAENDYFQMLVMRLLKNVPEIIREKIYIQKYKLQDINHLIIK